MNITYKGLIVAGMIFLMLVPTLFIMNLVDDRASRKKEVLSEVTSKWASDQTVCGPVLMVPYGKGAGGHIAYFLPEHLRIRGDLQPQVHYRSIYKVPVYLSTLDLEGDFGPLDMKALQIDPAEVHWNEAALCMGINDLRGIGDTVQVRWDEQTLTADPGLPGNEVMDSGVSVKPALAAGDSLHHFAVHLLLKGSNQLFFTPLGKATEAHLSSAWSSPSFGGSFLPVNKTTDAKGFIADWKVLYLNRSYPQSWSDKKYNLTEAAFGVGLWEGQDLYSLTTRSIKYAILFISLTFALYFFLEIFQEKRVHLMQYVLVGLALCIFYTLLLSISEYVTFGIAYAIAAAATVLLIALYTGSVFGKARVGWIFGSVLTGLYGFIYVLLRLEDGALLAGSIGLFGILALVMYYSRKIDWHKGAVLKESFQY